MWVKHMTAPDNASWKAMPMFFLNELLGLDTFKCSLVCAERPERFPEFYWQILKCWTEPKKRMSVVKPEY
jgi:hypothetical protein